MIFTRNFVNDDSSDFTVLRGIGWAMFVLSLLDLCLVLIPPQLFNAEWEFQAAGALMERIPVPLIGLGLIFLGKGILRKGWEKFWLRYLSWGTLLTGIVICLILVPVILLTSYTRLSDQLEAQYNDQFRSQVAQSTELQEQIRQADSEALESLIQQSNQPANQSPEAYKKDLIDSLGEAQNKAKQVLANEKNQRLMVMRKNALKWMISSVVASITLIFIWRVTAWAR